MTNQKQTVQRFMDAFNQLDHAAILACLTDDIEWIIPGFAHNRGKEAFDKEIENPAFEGTPIITVTRMTEEANIVIAEGSVVTKPKGQPHATVAFCDVFEFENNLVRRLTSYLANIPTT